MEKKYFELQTAIDELKEGLDPYHPSDRDDGIEYCIDKLKDDVPAADVAPVVHGKWVTTNTFDDCVYAKCSECDVTQIFFYNKPLTNFCPDCGAKMDLK